MKLEYQQMFEVEGGTERWCMQLLRHETGHAIDTAYRLHRRKVWRKCFGPFTRNYPQYCTPRPQSRNYVLHLDWWYTQSHPAEDYAETFAVWLKPSSKWRKDYAAWPALKKLQTVDEIMASIAGAVAPVRSRRQVDPLSKKHQDLAPTLNRKTPTLWHRSSRYLRRRSSADVPPQTNARQKTSHGRSVPTPRQSCASYAPMALASRRT